MIVRLLLAAAVVAIVASVFVFRAAGRMPDFEVYRQAGVRAAAAEPLYRDEDEHYQLKYLPAFAILAVPAAFVPLPFAKAAWFALSVILLGILLGLSLALLPARHKPAWVLILLTIVAMAKFYGHELVLGQVNILLATVVVTAVVLLGHDRQFTAGLLVALAVVVKPYAVIFVPWLAARRAARAVAGSAAGIAVALLLPVIPYGWQGALSLHRDWWRTVIESTAPNLLNADNVSLAAMYAKWMGPGTLAAFAAAATALLLIVITARLVLMRRGPSSAGLEAALLLTLIPLLSPQGWDYVFLISTPAVMYVINYERALPAPIRVAAVAALAVIAFSIYDLMGRQAYAAFMALSIITVCYLVIVAALATLRASRVV